MNWGTYIVIFAIVIGIWDAIWKIFALKKAAKNNHTKWFIAMFLINSAGILPMIYLKYYQSKH